MKIQTIENLTALLALVIVIFGIGHMLGRHHSLHDHHNRHHQQYPVHKPAGAQSASGSGAFSDPI
jgi:hypothetical protein